MPKKEQGKQQKPIRQRRSQQVAKLGRGRQSLSRTAVSFTADGDQDEPITVLKTQVDSTGAALARLIADTRNRRVQALQDGDDASADQLLSLSLDYSDQLIQLGKGRLREFDNSTEVTSLIERFQALNAIIEKTIEQVEKVKKFIAAATKIATVVDQLIQAAMKAGI